MKCSIIWIQSLKINAYCLNLALTKNVTETLEDDISEIPRPIFFVTDVFGIYSSRQRL